MIMITGNIEATLNRVVDFILYSLPGMVKETFEENVLPVWKEMYEWFMENVWAKIKPLTEKEIEKIKQMAEEETQKERKELIKDIGNI